MLKEKYQKEIDEIISRYPVKRSALIPLLYLAQQDEGFVSEAAMKEIAVLLRLTPPQVYETFTFIRAHLKRVGNSLQVCKSLMSRWLGRIQSSGGQDETRNRTGESTAAGSLPSARSMPRSLWHRAVMQANEDYYNGSLKKIDRILA